MSVPTPTARFQIDTTGRVECSASFQPLGWAIWADLSPFTQGYVEAMFASEAESMNGENSPGGYIEGREYGVRFDDLAFEALARIIQDCAAFEPEPTVAVTHEYGRQFWRVRQLDRLPKFPALTVFLAPDRKVRFGA